MARKELAEKIVGQKFNMLTVVEDLGVINGQRRVLAICECGTQKSYRLSHLKKKNGGTKSCGCILGFNGKGKRATDSVGVKYGKMLVLSIIQERGERPLANCVCDCGKIKNISLADLLSGKTKSCGCLLRETSKKRMTKHGISTHPIYMVWKGIKKRCYNKNDERYIDYGGRGVIVCDEWLTDPQAFYDWAIDKWKPGLEIDKDKKAKEMGVEGKMYSPEFCQFLTSPDNGKYTRANIWIEYNGKNMIVSEWSRETGISATAISNRFRKGLPLDQVFYKGRLPYKKSKS